MSGGGKRLHENFNNLSVHATSSARQHEELSATITNGDQRSQAEMIPISDNVAESRPLKLPRLDLGIKAREPYKPSGAEDSGAELPFSLDGKAETREPKETRESNFTKLKVNSDEKGGHGDFKTDTNEERAVREAGKDVRMEHSHVDYRSYTSDRDYRGGWKRDQRFDHKEDPRESWKDHNTDFGASGHVDDPMNFIWSKRLGRKNSLEEDGEVRDTREIVGENKVDLKREEKEKDREKKIKDDSYRERLDKEVRKQYGDFVPVPWSYQDRDGKEKKERGRDKERDKKDHMRRVEKEDPDVAKKDVDEFGLKKSGSDEGAIAGNSELERKSSRELETWKEGEREEREKKKERDYDKKTDAEKKTRDQEKEPEETSPEEGAGEREKETFVNYSFQQRKRMLRARGHSQVAGKDGRPRFLSKETDGNQGSGETTAVLYRPGEYMPELAKLWKDYEALSMKNGESTRLNQGPTIEIRIPAKLVSTSNHQVRGSQLWGTDVYTDDSDLVAVLMHTGYYRPTAASPPLSISELRATVRVLPPQDSYTSTLRNNVRSRAWGAASGCSYSVEQCHIVKVGGGHIELEPCLTRIWAVAPTLAPAAMERTMTTRAASANAYRQQRLIQEVTIQYNLCNEPWMKYSMSIVADRGLKKSQYTSARLRRGEVLYVETHRNRYELCYDGEKVTCNGGGFGATTATSAPCQAGEKVKDNDMDKILSNQKQNGERVQGRATHNSDKGHLQGQNGEASDHYRWARCRQPLPLKVMLSKGIPLPLEAIEVLEDGLAWEEIQWSQAGVWVRGKEYPLARAQFLSPNLEDIE